MRFMDLDSTEWQGCKNAEYTQLIDQLKEGGRPRERAMNCLFEKLFHQVYQMQGRFGALSEEDILTAYSKAMINMMNAVIQDNFRGESAFTTWFYSIFYRRCVDIARKRPTKSSERDNLTPTNPETATPKNQMSDSYGMEETSMPEWKEISDDSTNPEHLMVLLEQSEEENESFQKIMGAIQKAMGKMTENCQQLLQAYFEGYKMEEIADMAELKNAHTARQSVFRCRNRLRKGILQELEPYVNELGNRCQGLIRSYFGGQSTKKIAASQGLAEDKIQRAISNCFGELKNKISGEEIN